MRCLTADMANKVNHCIRQVSADRVAVLKREFKAKRIEIAKRLPVATPECGVFVSAMQEAVCDWLDESVSAFSSALTELVQYVETPAGLSAEIQAILKPEVDQLGVVAYGVVFNSAEADTETTQGPRVRSEIDRRKAEAWSRLITELDRLEARLEKTESDTAKDRRWKQKEIVITSMVAIACAVFGVVLGPYLFGDPSTSEKQPAAPIEKNAEVPVNTAQDSLDTSSQDTPRTE